jgi:hypothetical protein
MRAARYLSIILTYEFTFIIFNHDRINECGAQRPGFGPTGTLQGGEHDPCSERARRDKTHRSQT